MANVLSDILVSHAAHPLNGCSRLGDFVDIIAFEDQLVLLRFRFRDDHTLQHLHVADSLLFYCFQQAGGTKEGREP